MNADKTSDGNGGDAGGERLRDTPEAISVSQFNTGPIPTGTMDIRPRTDIYTVLLILASVLLLAGIIFVVVRSYQLFGGLSGG